MSKATVIEYCGNVPGEIKKLTSAIALLGYNLIGVDSSAGLVTFTDPEQGARMSVLVEDVGSEKVRMIISGAENQTDNLLLGIFSPGGLIGYRLATGDPVARIAKKIINSMGLVTDARLVEVQDSGGAGCLLLFLTAIIVMFLLFITSSDDGNGANPSVLGEVSENSMH